MKKLKNILISAFCGMLIGIGATFATLYFTSPKEETSVTTIVDFDLGKVLKNCAKLSLIELTHNVEIVSTNDFLFSHSNALVQARAFVSVGIDCDYAFVEDGYLVIPHSEVLNVGIFDVQVLNEQQGILAPFYFTGFTKTLNELINKEKENENLIDVMKQADDEAVKFLEEELANVGSSLKVRFLGDKV